ncbi:hypothetical protein PUN28_017562 [Cardiocondyla obscurior]|uniref:Uncharacterized protein n=1 Tax=Cardiocondyla obscurior TaxID=286306 RepID=A0AAW2ENX4_9HYME
MKSPCWLPCNTSWDWSGFGGRREINTGRLSTWRGVGRCVHHEERGSGLTAATGTALIVTLTLIAPLNEIQKLVIVGNFRRIGSAARCTIKCEKRSA